MRRRADHAFPTAAPATLVKASWSGNGLVNGRAAGLAGQLQKLDHLRPIALKTFPWRAAVNRANRRRLAHDFTHHPAGLHYARRAERLVGDANASPGHE